MIRKMPRVVRIASHVHRVNIVQHKDLQPLLELVVAMLVTSVQRVQRLLLLPYWQDLTGLVQQVIIAQPDQQLVLLVHQARSNLEPVGHNCQAVLVVQLVNIALSKHSPLLKHLVLQAIIV